MSVGHLDHVLIVYSSMEHMTWNPLRLIVDYTGYIGYRTSRALAAILAPLVGRSDHHLNNSKHLANEMISVMVEEDKMFISHVTFH